MKRSPGLQRQELAWSGGVPCAKVPDVLRDSTAVFRSDEISPIRMFRRPPRRVRAVVAARFAKDALND